MNASGARRPIRASEGRDESRISPEGEHPWTRRRRLVPAGSRERAPVVRPPASFVLFRSVLSQGRGEHRSANRRQGRWFGGRVGLRSANRRRRWPRASRIDPAADGRLAVDGRWAASGGYGDCDGSDSGGAGSAGEARGRETGAWRGRRAWAADSGLSPQEEEFRWLLHDEVHAVLRQLQDILKVTPRRVAVCLCACPPSPPLLLRLLTPGRLRLPPKRLLCTPRAVFRRGPALNGLGV